MTATTQDSGASITVHLPVRLDELDHLGIVHSSTYLKYKEILQATTTIVSIDPAGKPIPIPSEVREALSRPA